MNKKNISDVDLDGLRGRTVIVRADLNVPLDAGVISDDQRIQASLPTLRRLTDAGARVVLLSHLGRPKGQVDPAYSLAPVATRLNELLEPRVHFVPHTDGGAAVDALDAVGEGEVALLENTRFVPGETTNDPALAASWAALGDLFVNDAFGTAHRAHASTAGLAEAMRSKGGEAVAGLLLARELEFLAEALRLPERPFVAIIGGAKISSKIGVVSSLLPRVDRLLIGGAMANTFFRALGLGTGDSLVEEDSIGVAKELLDQGGDRRVLPVDCIVASEITPDAERRPTGRTAVQPGDRILDIGPRTRELFAGTIGEARTIVWNGPMGVFEIDAFAEGTVHIAHAVATACDAGAIGILGGGDSAAAAQRAGVMDRLTHVSTGGGASLELLAGAELPGVDALTDRSS
ncbi:MAG: phosphoglycerate kinase [Longimicrobiales bacterium]